MDHPAVDNAGNYSDRYTSSNAVANGGDKYDKEVDEIEIGLDALCKIYS